MNTQTTAGQDGRPSFCTWCGAGMFGDERFCAGCGREVAWARPPGSPIGQTPEDLPVTGPQADVTPSESEVAFFGLGPEEVDTAPDRRRRWVVAIAAGTAVVVVVAVLAALFYQRQLERPIVAALTDSQTAFSPALTALATASDLTEVKTGARVMRTSLRTLHAAQQSLQGHDSELSRAAADVVSAQTQVAESVAPLTDLTADDTSAWGSQHTRLVDGIAALERARDGLAAVDGDRATTSAQARQRSSTSRP